MANTSYLIDYSVSDVIYAEPVTLAEAKLYIRVSHTSEDAEIAEMITAARQAIELAAGISIVTKQVTVWFSNKGGFFQLPYGPVTSSVTLYEDTTGTVLTDKKIVGGKYPVVTFPAIDNLKAVYNAGYAVVPKELKFAILDQVNHMYENRGAGAEGMGICEKAWRACQQFTRTSPIL